MSALYRTVLAVTGCLVAVCSLLAGVAHADTERCVALSEFDKTTTFMSVQEVANLFDVDGFFLSANAEHFRRGYRSCWATGDERAVVAFDQTTGLTSHWAIRNAD